MLLIIAGTANCPILRGLGCSLHLLWIGGGGGGGVFNVPEGDSHKNTEPPFIA